MSDVRCALAGCGRPVHDSLICDQHMWELQRHLAEIPALLADLDTTLARQSKSGPATEKVTGKGETPVAFSVAASDKADSLRWVLIHWARRSGMPWAEYATTSAAYLLAVLPGMATHGDLPEMWDAITHASALARRVTDSPPNRTIIPVGPCPEMDENGAACMGKVNAFIPTDDRPARMVCEASEGHAWSSMQWLRAGKRIVDLINKRAREERQRLALFGAPR